MELLNGDFRVRDRVSIVGRPGEWLILRLAYGIATLEELERVSFETTPRLNGRQAGALIENLLLLDNSDRLALLKQRTA
jgi:hypothetical protein